MPCIYIIDGKEFKTGEELKDYIESPVFISKIASLGNDFGNSVKSVIRPEVVSETVSDIEPPVVEQTTTDVGGVTAPDVSDKIFIHETNAPVFDKFDIEKSGTGQGENWLGKGVYLQEEGTFKIEKYGKNKIITKLNPNAKIFQTVDTPNGEYTDTFVEWAVNNTEVGKRKAQERIEDGLSLKNLLPRDILKRNQEAVEKLKEQGYDGLYIDGELVVYNPNVLEIQNAQKAEPSESARKSENLAVSDDVAMFEQVLTINDTTKLKSSKKAKIKEVIESKADNDIISYIAENIDDIKAQLRDKVGLTTECKW